jgi:hypothetical protein
LAIRHWHGPFRRRAGDPSRSVRNGLHESWPPAGLSAPIMLCTNVLSSKRLFEEGCVMKIWASLIGICGLLAFAQPVTVAHAKVSVEVTTGGSSWGKGRISCSRGARILRDRGYRDIVRKDCYGRFYVYRAWRDSRRYEIALDARSGRVVDRRRVR